MADIEGIRAEITKLALAARDIDERLEETNRILRIIAKAADIIAAAAERAE